MLNRPLGFWDLDEAFALLPDLFDDPDGWRTLDIDYHPPRVERLWRQLDENRRLMLHCMHPCSKEVALLHPHNAPTVMEVTSGTYGMIVGYGSGVEPPQTCFESRVVVPTARVTPVSKASYRYAMLHPDAWHAVIPETLVYSIMIFGNPWDRPIPEVTKSVKGTLPELSNIRKQELLERHRQEVMLRLEWHRSRIIG